jgi:hypothetical protein
MIIIAEGRREGEVNLALPAYYSRIPVSPPKICLYFMVKKSGLIGINKTAQQNDSPRILLQLS